MQDRRCIYFNQPHLWRSGLAYCFKTGGSICHQIPNSPVCRAIYYSDVATALIAYEAEVEYIEDGETHRTDLKSLIERHSVANGLACHEHLPILVTRFFVPAADAARSSPPQRRNPRPAMANHLRSSGTPENLCLRPVQPG